MGSLEAKRKEGLGLDEIAPSAGPEEIATPGTTVSTVNERDTTWLSFPGASIALTKKVWRPSERWGSVYGEPQRLKGLRVEPALEGRAGLVRG